MKQFRFAILASAMLMMAACSSEEDRPTVPVPQPEPPEPGVSVGVGPELVTTFNEYGFNTLKEQLANSNNNFSVSPYGQVNGLGLISRMMSEVSNPVIKNLFFGYSILSFRGIPDRMLKAISQSDPSSELLVSRSVWVSSLYSIDPELEEIAAWEFQGTANTFNITPSGETGRLEVNKWGNEVTSGFISELLPNSISGDLAMFSTTVISSTWANKMETSGSLSFSCGDGTISTPEFIDNRNDLRVPVSQADGFSMVSIPLGNRFYYMSFILPPSEKYPTLLTPEIWDDLLVAMTSKKVLARIPKFTSITRSDLISYFDNQRPGAWNEAEYIEFTTDPNGPKVPNVAMAGSVVTVDEKGCNTSKTMTYSGNLSDGEPEMTITFDRPFYFVLHEIGRKWPGAPDSRVGLIFNIGWIADPSAN